MKKEMKKMGKGRRSKAAACMICAICLGLSGCTWEEEEIRVQLEHEEETDFTLVEVIRGDVVKQASVQLQIREGETHDSAFLINDTNTGYIEVGDTIEEGQLIWIRGDNEAAEAEIKELEYKIARNTLLMEYLDINENYALSERWWSYVYQSSGSDSEWEKLQDSLESIRQTYRYQREDYQDTIELDTQRLEMAREELEQSYIYSYYSGVISSIDILELNNGKYLRYTLSGEVENIFDSQALGYIDYFSEGDMVEIVVKQGSDRITMEAVPYEMEYWEERKTLSFEVLTAGLQDEEEAKYLKSGATGTIDLTLDRREDVLCVSKNVVHRADGRRYVYVLGENDIREIRWVEVGLEGDTMVEIISGLEEGEYVILK